MKIHNNNSLSYYYIFNYTSLYQRPIKWRVMHFNLLLEMLLFWEHCRENFANRKDTFYIQRCTRGVHTPFRCTHIGYAYKCGNVRSRRDDGSVSQTVWFKGKRGHYAQLHDKLSGQRSMYLTLNSATDYCENASQWYRFKRAPRVFFLSLLSFTIGLP